jgi:hypothetical protein
MTRKEIQEHEMLRYEVEQAGEVLGAMADGKTIKPYVTPFPFLFCRMSITLIKLMLPRF